MTTKDDVTALLNGLKKAERLADPSLLIETIRELGNLEEPAEEAIPPLLSLFTRNYDVPELRDALKTTLKKLGADITRYEPFGKLRILTRLLLLFGLIMLNGSLFGWGAARDFPFDYLPASETGPMLLELLSEGHVVVAQGNYYWVLTTFLTTAVYYSLYLAYVFYLSRLFPSFPPTTFKAIFGLLIPLFGLLFGIFSIEQTIDSWLVFSSKTPYQQVLVLGFLSSLWSILINVQFNSFVNGILQGAIDRYLPAKTSSPLQNDS